MKGYVNKCELVGGSSRLDGSHEVKKASYIKIVRYYVAKTLSSIVTLFPLLGEGLRERVLLEGRKIRRYEDRPLQLTEVKRTGGQAIISNKSLTNFTNSSINETILPSCPPVFCSSDSYPPQPSLIREGAASFCHCERQNVAPQSQDSCNMNMITTQTVKKDKSPNLKRTYSLIDIFTHSHCKFNSAFTLAEVLITLGIIGVVAAMTIPSVIAKYQEAQLKAQFKKTYSTILQAMQYVTIENGGYIDCYYNGGNKQSLCQPFYKQMAEHIKYVKYCPKNSYEEGCIPKYKSYHTGGCYGFNEHGMNDNAFTYVLADGSLLISYDYGQEAIFAVDINGKKGPNDRGKDLFSFVIYKNDTGGYYIGDNITYCMDTSDNKSVYIDDMYK